LSLAELLQQVNNQLGDLLRASILTPVHPAMH
jgi:hypothetical protein